MTKVQNAWKNMRIDYQIRYARMCRKVKETSSIQIIMEL